MVDLVAELCSERCAGRAPGTPEGLAARAVVGEALRTVGLETREQPVPGCGGANILGAVPGEVDRWVMVEAHYDHLGRMGRTAYWGADDNAAAVAILVEVAAAFVASPPSGRGVILASFDAEEPPNFLNETMGAMHYVREPSVALDTIDMMVCMDLVGHAVGPEAAPPEVRNTVFALGAERSEGTAEHVDRIAVAVEGATIRRADAEVIPPLSDYCAFWEQSVPFLFLSNARWRHYHTPEDTPDKLDYDKMVATAAWLERFVRETCARPESAIRFLPDGRDDAATLRGAIDLMGGLTVLSDEAKMGLPMARALLAVCDEAGRLPVARRPEIQMLVGLLESRLG
jgi:Zn-dependent M28 family amino/carboxypeptidase